LGLPAVEPLAAEPLPVEPLAVELLEAAAARLPAAVERQPVL
jgi:hypothetical protein